MAKPPRWREPGPLDYAFMLGGTIFVLALAIVILILASRDGRAAEQDRGAWFKSLRTPPSAAKPNGGDLGSCCDVSDCKKTKARYVGANWWALLPTGREIMIPNEKVLLKPKSIDGEAYLCASEGAPATDGTPSQSGSFMYMPQRPRPKIATPPYPETVYCFVPPLSLY